MRKVYLLILFFVFAAHGLGVSNGITWDDRYLLPKAENASFANTFLDRSAGSTSEENSYYRPLRTLLFKIVLSLPGPAVSYLHFLSIIMHFLVAVILFRICLAMTGSRGVSLICGLLFSVHPLNTEAVAGISNIKEILSTMFVLLAVYNIWKVARGDNNYGKTSFLICIYTLAGLLSKETAFVIPLFALLIVFVYRNNWRKTLVYAAAPVLIITACYSFLIFALVPGPEKGEYILYSLPITLYTTCSAFIKYFQLVMFPLELSIRHDILWVTDFLNWEVISVTIVLLALTGLTIHLMIKKDSRAVPLLFFLIALAPLSNVIPIRGQIMSERYFYMPLAGLLLSIACFLPKANYEKKYLLTLVIPLILLFSLRTALRTLEWKDDRTLFESAVKVAPDSLVVRWNLLEVYRANNERDKARTQYQEMLRINREVTISYIDYAKKLESDGNILMAERIWTKAEYVAAGQPELVTYVRSERGKQGTSGRNRQ